MKIRRIEIERWRNLAELTIELDADADFICLVGENGVGKSNLLELIAFASPHLGLGPESVPKRSLPFQRNEPFGIAVTLDLEDAVDIAEEPLQRVADAWLQSWDRTITFHAQGMALDVTAGFPDDERFSTSSTGDGYGHRFGFLADGIMPLQAANEIAGLVIGMLRNRQEVLHLYIDAERVFPAVAVSDAEVLESSRQDPAAPQWVREQAAMATQNLYTTWMRGLLGAQQRYQADYLQLAQRAARDGNPPPLPEDPLSAYRDTLAAVLPHLRFVRLDHADRRLIYDSAGQEIPYEGLSGGERELAFLVGQIERFGVRHGLFLLDEPELHLNAELQRRWLDHLRSSTDAGQVWIATHSLEAVETAGLTATLVMDRDADRVVRRVEPLGERHALARLVPLLGTPGFSLVDSTFLLIEGDRPGRERERFAQVTGAGPGVRFLEAGGCKEVAAKFAGLLALASATEQLRVGAVIDRDHRTQAQAEEFERVHEVEVLSVHEIENFFLNPPLLDTLLVQRGGGHEGGQVALVNEAADPLAGLWVWERAVTQGEWTVLPAACQHNARRLAWAEIDADVTAAATQILEPYKGADHDDATFVQRRAAIAANIRAYAELRNDPDRLWVEVCGKEVLKAVAVGLGFRDAEALESRAAHLWRSGEVDRPPQAAELLAYIEALELRG